MKMFVRSLDSVSVIDGGKERLQDKRRAVVEHVSKCCARLHYACRSRRLQISAHPVRAWVTLGSSSTLGSLWVCVFYVCFVVGMGSLKAFGRYSRLSREDCNSRTTM